MLKECINTENTILRGFEMSSGHIEYSAISALTVPLVRKVFERIAESGNISFGKLRLKLSELENDQSKVDRTEIIKALNKLTELHLIDKVESSSINSPDFRTYYMTPDGLQTKRELKSIRFGETA